MTSALLLLCLAGAPEAFAALGGQLDADPHGVLDAGLRSGPYSLQLRTDTLELSYAPTHTTGRAWVTLRLQGFAAQMLISPWANGAKDPSRALVAMMGEVNGGWVENLGHGFYSGLRARARGYLFFARSEETSIATPDPTARFEPGAFVGYWSEPLRAELGTRAYLGGERVGANVEGTFTWAPAWAVAPRVSAWFGVGENLDFLTTTRLGGLNPYVVPLAGAAWAEWWVEDYVAGRAGVAANLGPVELTPFVDAARFDGTNAVGFGLKTHATFEDFFVTAIGGYAPFIERAPGVSRVSVWVLTGSSWIAL